MKRLDAFARAWLGPALAGLAGAGLLIVGAEVGGALGWVLIGLVACALVGMVAWVMHSAYRDSPFDGLNSPDE